MTLNEHLPRLQGRVVVARNQGVYDNDMSDLWRVSSVYNLGCRRTENHASGEKYFNLSRRLMRLNVVTLQVSSNKRDMKAELNHEHCAEQTEFCSEPNVVLNPFNTKVFHKV